MHKLIAAEGHVFVELDEGRFILDTGSPMSFGDVSIATSAGAQHQLPQSLMGLDVRAGELHTGLSAWDTDAKYGDIIDESQCCGGIPADVHRWMSGLRIGLERQSRSMWVAPPPSLAL